MPYKDLKKREERRKNTYLQIMIYLRKDVDAKTIRDLEAVVQAKNTTKAEYAKDALLEKLLRDGYLRKPRD